MFEVGRWTHGKRAFCSDICSSNCSELFFFSLTNAGWFLQENLIHEREVAWQSTCLRDAWILNLSCGNRWDLCFMKGDLGWALMWLEFNTFEHVLENVTSRAFRYQGIYEHRLFGPELMYKTLDGAGVIELLLLGRVLIRSGGIGNPNIC